MILSRKTITSVKPGALQVPSQEVFSLPEKILQFGTGVLLRGLPDYFVDKANRQGKFNGRIVIVKSTAGGDASSFEKQDALYTICVRGIEGGEKVEENIVSSSVSRVIAAQTDWPEVLACAANPDIRIIISNTTEVGIALVKESITNNPPESFPAKLLSVLHQRYISGGRDEAPGFVIIPTELIVDNGIKLKAIVNELAAFNNLDAGFIDWIEKSNHFCSSLVDRIVPGKPSEQVRTAIQQNFGYDDELMIMAEVYRLWAIQGDENIKAILSFAEVDEGVVIEPDIDIYRELKLRMLNGTHTLSCGLAVIAGFETVKDAMVDTDMSDFIATLMLGEIAAGIPYQLAPGVASTFGKKVLDRFRNPYIDHKWISITMQFTSKMKMRNVPVLKKYFEENDTPPASIALGFAAYILFMKANKEEGGKYYGTQNGVSYQIQDDQAAHLNNLWKSHTSDSIVQAVLGDAALWGTDLSALPGFAVAVNEYLQSLIKHGGRKTLTMFQQNKTLV